VTLSAFVGEVIGSEKTSLAFYLESRDRMLKILENLRAVIHGDIQHIINSFCKNMPKIATL